MNETIRLLADINCSICKYLFKSSTPFISTKGEPIIPLGKMFCNYENIEIYRPKGMELAISKVVTEKDYCDNFIKKNLYE